MGVLLGIAAVLAAARFVPWVDPPRLPSETTVVANGGRAEQFVIRLPADRIAGAGSSDAGLRAAAFPGGAELPDELLSRPLLVEQYKVRNRAGQVVGIAARHWTEAAGDAAIAWLIVIPSRGALMLTSAGERARAVDRAIGATGYRAGEAWTGDVTVRVAEPETGRIRAGSAEFEGLDGHFTETWNVTGVGAAGELKGTIELDTVMLRGT